MGFKDKKKGIKRIKEVAKQKIEETVKATVEKSFNGDDFTRGKKKSIGDQLLIMVFEDNELNDGMLSEFTEMLDDDTRDKMMEHPPTVYLKLGSDMENPSGLLVPDPGSMLSKFAKLAIKLVKLKSDRIATFRRDKGIMNKTPDARRVSKDIDKLVAQASSKVFSVVKKANMEGNSTSFVVQMIMDLLTTRDGKQGILNHLKQQRTDAEKIWETELFPTKKGKKKSAPKKDESADDKKDESKETQSFALRTWTGFDEYQSFMLDFDSKEPQKMSSFTDIREDIAKRLVIKNVPEDVITSISATIMNKVV